MSDKDWVQLLDYVVNDEDEKAKALLHNIIVENGKEIYRNLDENENKSEETSEENSDFDGTENPEETGEMEDRVIDIENSSSEIKSVLDEIGNGVEEIKQDIQKVIQNTTDGNSDEDENDKEGDDDNEMTMDIGLGNMGMNNDNDSTESPEDKEMSEAIEAYHRRNRISETSRRNLSDEFKRYTNKSRRVQESNRDIRSRKIREKMEENAKLMAAPKADLSDRSDSKSRRSAMVPTKGNNFRMSKGEEKGRPAPKPGSLFSQSKVGLRSAPKADLSDRSDSKSRRSAMMSNKMATKGNNFRMSKGEEKGRPAPKVGNLRKSK